jgi:hypothetical protein
MHTTFWELSCAILALLLAPGGEPPKKEKSNLRARRVEFGSFTMPPRPTDAGA